MARRRRSGSRGLRELNERKYRLRAKTTRVIPDADSDFALMAKLFAQHAAKHAERFKLSPEHIEKLTSAVEEYRNALCTTLQPDTAGPKATRIKNDARAEAEKIVRAVARALRGAAEESLTPVDRMILNLHERPQKLKTRSCPQIAPVLRFIGATHGHASDLHGGGGARHILEYINDFDYASSAKPHGSTRMELFVELVPVGQAVPSHPGQRSGGRLWYLRSYSTSRFEVDFPVLNDGTPALVVYWGRWADARGGFGPFSKTCVARVEGGSLPQLVHLGTNRPAIASVSRHVEPKYEVTQVVYALPEGLDNDNEKRVESRRLLPALEMRELK